MNLRRGLATTVRRASGLTDRMVPAQAGVVVLIGISCRMRPWGRQAEYTR